MNNRQKRRLKKRQTGNFRVPLQTIVPANQPCGECQACCEVVAVPEINKPLNQRCQHQCENGCGIYETRPEACRTYFCWYQGGFLGTNVEMRPDKLGIIMDFRTSHVGDCISAWEVREGAADEPLARSVLETWATRFVIFIRRYHSTRRTVMGPPHKLMEIQQITEHL